MAFCSVCSDLGEVRGGYSMGIGTCNRRLELREYTNVFSLLRIVTEPPN